MALRQWITRGKGALGLVSNVKNWLKDGAFLLEYRNIQADHLNKPISFGAIGSENDLPHIFTYQTSKSYNGVSITTGNFEGTDVLHVGKLAPTNVGTCINAAIWLLMGWMMLYKVKGSCCIEIGQWWVTGGLCHQKKTQTVG